MYEVTLYEDATDKTGIIIHYPSVRGTKLTSGVIAAGINVVNTFMFSMNLKNPAYNKVKPRKSLINVRNLRTEKDEFNGYILRQNSSMSDSGMYSKSFTAVDGLNYLKETLQPFEEIRNKTPKEFLEIVLGYHNDQTEDHKKFKVGNVNVTNSTDNVYRFLSQEMNTFDTIFDKLVDRLGGEVRARLVDGQWYLDWLTQAGEEKETEICVGKNLKSHERDENTESVVTRWYPYGATLEARKGIVEWIEPGENELLARIEIDNGQDTEYVDIPIKLLPQGIAVFDEITIYGESPHWYFKKSFSENSDVSLPRLDIKTVNNGKPYIDDPLGIQEFGVIADKIVLDDVTQPNNLLLKAIQHRNAYKQVTITNQVTAYDLSLIGKAPDAYEVYHSYPLDNPGVAAKELVRVVEKRTDIINPQSSTLTIGDKYQTASQYQANNKKSQKSFEEIKTTVVNQSKRITSLRNEINNVNEAVKVINIEIGEADIPGLKSAVNQLNAVVDELNISIGDIPNYGLVTSTEDGLMAAPDKVKLDGLKNYQLATGAIDGLMSKDDKQKLNRITANQAIDLDQFMADFLALKEKVENTN